MCVSMCVCHVCVYLTCVCVTSVSHGHAAVRKNFFLFLSSIFSSPLTTEGRPGMSDVSPLSGISGLSFDSTLLSPVLFFLVLLPFLPDLFLLAGPFF